MIDNDRQRLHHGCKGAKGERRRRRDHVLAPCLGDASRATRCTADRTHNAEQTEASSGAEESCQFFLHACYTWMVTRHWDLTPLTVPRLSPSRDRQTGAREVNGSATPGLSGVLLGCGSSPWTSICANWHSESSTLGCKQAEGRSSQQMPGHAPGSSRVSPAADGKTCILLCSLLTEIVLHTMRCYDTALASAFLFTRS